VSLSYQALRDLQLRSRLFVEESKRNSIGLREQVVSFAHETTGKYLASRYLRSLLSSNEYESTARLEECCEFPRFEESFRFLIDELESSTSLDKLASIVLRTQSSSSLSLLAYMIGSKNVEQVGIETVQAFAYAQARLEMRDLEVDQVESAA
jgi:hypothetical protein